MRHSRSSHGTFWDKTRIEHNLTIDDVGRIMGVGRTAASAYLSGLSRPSKAKATALCEYCGIDFKTGYHEFTKAYNAWEKRHPGCVRNGNSYKKVATTSDPFGDVPLYMPEPIDLSAFNIDGEPSRKSGGLSRDTINNFWSNKKVEKKLSFKDLAKATNKPLTSVRNYFIGRMTPDDETIRALCDVMEVDYDQGVAEFAKFGKVARRRARGAKKARATDKATVTAPVVDYLELLYGKVSFEDFQLLRTAAKTKEDVLPFVYGQVDYATYCQIATTL